MKRLARFKLRPLTDWWFDTLVILGVFVPLGGWFGFGFISDVLKGELIAPGLTPLGYFIVLFPAATSAACFGTVGLRLAGKRSAWLGCVSVLLVMMTVLLGMVVMVLVIALVGTPPWVVVLLMALAVASLALTIREWHR